jgi:hypothetical protein
MTMHGQHPSIVEDLPKCRQPGSSLVRRLVRAKDDPGKQRIRRWLCAINDERLLDFGLTTEDIALLRGSGSSAQAGSRRLLPGGARPPDVTVQTARALNRQRFPRRASHDRRSA